MIGSVYPVVSINMCSKDHKFLIITKKSLYIYVVHS